MQDYILILEARVLELMIEGKEGFTKYGAILASPRFQVQVTLMSSLNSGELVLETHRSSYEFSSISSDLNHPCSREESVGVDSQKGNTNAKL